MHDACAHELQEEVQWVLELVVHTRFLQPSGHRASVHAVAVVAVQEPGDT